MRGDPVATQDRHPHEIAPFAVVMDVAPQEPLARETALLIDADRGDVVGIDAEFDAMRPHADERDFAHLLDRERADTAPSFRRIENRDRELEAGELRSPK